MFGLKAGNLTIEWVTERYSCQIDIYYTCKYITRTQSYKDILGVIYYKIWCGLRDFCQYCGE
jgi:hypothetical protein